MGKLVGNFGAKLAWKPDAAAPGFGSGPGAGTERAPGGV